MIHLAWPWMLLCLVLPLVIRWLLPPAGSAEAALQVPFYSTLTLSKTQQKGKNWFIKLLTIFLWCLLVIAASRPQLLGETVEVPVSGRDLMLAVDVSGSMKARDIPFKDQPQSRLGAVKRVAGEFIHRRIGDRLGLILFGTNAYLQAPLSLDRTTVDQLLQESAIGIAGEKTAIGDAIGLAIKRFESRDETNKVLILLTDGSNTAGTVEPSRAADLASSVGVRIHTIGIGATSQQVSSIFGTQMLNPSAELDERMLKQIADVTGGQYFRATDSDSLENIYQLIDKIEPVERDTSNLRPSKDLFFWPLGLATLIALCFCLFSCLRSLQQTWISEKPTATQKIRSEGIG